MKRQFVVPLFVFLGLAMVSGARFAAALAEPIGEVHARDLLLRLLSADEGVRSMARAGIIGSGDRAILPALVDALFFAPPEARSDVVLCLEGLSGERLGSNYRYWFEWIGGHEDIRSPPWYRRWKAALFSRIDPAFARFLDPALPLTIRPEEILWGGVRKDGIPALRNPPVIPASEASYLDSSETVFGITVRASSRAYPQRILDWHEMANDSLGGEPFALSYCTLCGSAIAYATWRQDGPPHVFGSSGLLYRSNKLMYDEATLSLWSNLTGEPVAGLLAGRGIMLPMLPLTVTSWGDWKVRHPDTTVLALRTGFSRDYTPGAAYGKYFASPETMFPVWKRDPTLERKSVVFAIRRAGAAKAYPLDLLFRERVVNDTVGAEKVALVADPATGAVRAYERRGRHFAEGPKGLLVEPSTGLLWEARDEALVANKQGEGGTTSSALARVPGHLAFWFGWYAFFPETAVYTGCAPQGAGAVTLATLGGLSAWRAGGSDGRTTTAQGGGPDSCVLFDHSHAAWTAILNRYVKDGFVDYAGFREDGQADLGAYLSSLESVCRGHYDTWSREQKLAYWINAYNAYTVRLILNHYPLKSIRSIGLLPGAALRENFIPLKGVRGKILSLNDIEHEILRKDFTEPRIHLAIVCASKGCPTLRSEAYRAADLDRQLDEAARAFVRDPAKNHLDVDSRTLHLSSIFKWFREDFERAARTLPEFVARYADDATASALRSGGVRVEFLEYDWSLNGR